MFEYIAGLTFKILTTTPNVTQIVVPSDVGRTTLDHIENVFLEFAGGFTVTAGRGGWQDDAGANVLEPVMVYSIANLPQSAVETVANVLLYDASPVQSSVYVVLPDGRAGLYERSTGVDANDPGAVTRALAAITPGFQNGISPGSDYPDRAWLEPNRTFDHKVVTKENSSEFVAEVERRLSDGRRGEISPIYNTPDAYTGTLS